MARAGTPLTAAELRTLEAACDALLPADRSPWRDGVAARAVGYLARGRNPRYLTQLRWLLLGLDTPLAGLLLGSRGTRFSSLSPAEREQMLRAFARHPIGRVRGVFQGLKRLAAVSYYADSEPGGHNPVWPSMGYPGPPGASAGVAKQIVPVVLHPAEVAECDVVVVGSGAGGGVVASELAAAGHDVLVLERGEYFGGPDIDQRELASLERTFLDGGLVQSDDLGISIFAGSCLGGGTVVNYTASFRTPDAIRADWTRSSGLDCFVSKDFTRSLEAVCERLHVSAECARPSARDELLERGLIARSWHVGVTPRNVAGCPQDDACGYCGFGCSRGAKRSIDRTYLQDAYEHGARVAVGVSVDRVLIRQQQAVGVAARTAAGQALTVRAQAVVIAAGALSSPAILRRSGIAGQAGEHLFLHPTTAVWGHFDEAVRPWAGTLQARFSEEFADLNQGYGFRLETAPLHPAFLALGAAWDGAAPFDDMMRALPRTAIVGILTRDRESGRVSPDRSGQPSVRYRVSPYDQRHVRRGMAAAAEVLLAAGARAVFSPQYRSVAFRGGSLAKLGDWLGQVDRVGYRNNETFYFSFHQMGTCRMGGSRSSAVVDGSGAVYGIRGLYVADASLFPSASGVNPMITVAALAHYVAQHIKSHL